MKWGNGWILIWYIYILFYIFIASVLCKQCPKLVNKMNLFNCLWKNGFPKQRNWSHPRVCHSTKKIIFSLTFLAQPPDDKDNGPRNTCFRPKKKKTRYLYASHWNLTNWSNSLQYIWVSQKHERVKNLKAEGVSKME